MTSLLVFEAAARRLSFSDAAAEMNLTQGAVSRQIRALEETLGLQLFHRVRNRLTLSEAGSAYLPEVRACLSRLEAATLELLAHQGTGGVLNLAILPTFGTKWLIPRMASFARAHPNIVVNFTTRAVAFDFAKERLDAAIHFGDVTWPGVKSHRLMGEEVVPVCSAAALRAHALTSLEDFEHHTLLQHTTRPNAWVEWFAAVGQPQINGLKGPRFEHFSMVIQAAIAGIGVAVLPRFLVEDEIAAGRLIIPFDRPVCSNHAYYLVYPEEKADLPGVRAFRDWLLGEVAHWRA
ncbi:MAG: transcriptional regulator GcvA [Proteobacteria bacterium]|nr:transcriptional regulator GcvA [Pseudomonadota bacterium]